MQTVEFCLPCDNSLESVFSPGFDLNLQWLIKIMKEKKEEEEKKEENPPEKQQKMTTASKK